MKSFSPGTVCLITAIGLGIVGPAFATDQQTMTYGNVHLEGGVGIIYLEANEIVFNGAGSIDNLSRLIWQSVSPTATGVIEVDLPENWTLQLDGQLAISGFGYMEDYDWLWPFRRGFGPDQWTDRSQHPNTNLDWFAQGSIAVGHDFAVNDTVTVNLNGGLKYTDVQWTALGGTYVYSVFGFRDFTGTFANVPGITYRQQLPAIFVGLDTEIETDSVVLELAARGGLVFNGLATDYHWARTPPLRFEDRLHPTPMASVSAKGSFAISDNLNAFVAGSAEGMFTGRADTTMFSNPTNTRLGRFNDSAGANLFSATIQAGISGDL